MGSCESHLALKRVDEEMQINDLADAEKGDALLGEYLEISRRIAVLIQRGATSPEIARAKDLLDKNFAEHFLPSPESPRFKLIQARQRFLDSLGQGLLYLGSKGMRRVWDVNSSETVRLLQNARNNIFRGLQGLPGAPTKSVDYHDAQIEDYQRQFTYRFIDAAFFQTKYACRIPQRLNDIELAVLKCLKAFVDVRKKIDEIAPLQDKHSIESMDFLPTLVQFATTFGKLKSLDLQKQNENLSSFR